MYAANFFPKAYFPGRYFPPAGTVTPPPPEPFSIRIQLARLWSVTCEAVAIMQLSLQLALVWEITLTNPTRIWGIASDLVDVWSVVTAQRSIWQMTLSREDNDMATKEMNIGDTNTITGTIREVVSGDLVDPTTVKVHVLSPSNALTTYTYDAGDESIFSKVSQGVYAFDLSIPFDRVYCGKWYVTFQGYQDTRSMETTTVEILVPAWPPIPRTIA